MIFHYFKLILVSVLIILYIYCFGITSFENFIKYGYFGTNCLIVTKSEEEVKDIPQPGQIILQSINYSKYINHIFLFTHFTK